MEPPVTESPAMSPPSPRRALLAKLGLLLFGLYVVALYVLALDQEFRWGLFPTKLDRQLNTEIQQLGDPKLAPDQRQAVIDDLVNWNSFAVPPLIAAIEKNQPGVRDPALQCLQAIAVKFYPDQGDITSLGADPVKLKAWWAKLQEQFAKADDKPKT